MTLVGTGDMEKHIPAMPAPSVMKVCRLGWELLFGIEEFKTKLKLGKKKKGLNWSQREQTGNWGRDSLEYLLPPR